MDHKVIEARVDELLNLGEASAKTIGNPGYGSTYVDNSAFSVFRTASLSFISSVFGQEHTFFKEFNAATDYKVDAFYSTKRGQGVLK